MHHLITKLLVCEIFQNYLPQLVQAPIFLSTGTFFLKKVLHVCNFMLSMK